jgi:hypothetical protein
MAWQKSINWRARSKMAKMAYVAKQWRHGGINPKYQNNQSMKWRNVRRNRRNKDNMAAKRCISASRNQ